MRWLGSCIGVAVDHRLHAGRAADVHAPVRERLARRGASAAYACSLDPALAQALKD